MMNQINDSKCIYFGHTVKSEVIDLCTELNILAMDTTIQSVTALQLLKSYLVSDGLVVIYLNSVLFL